MNECMDVLIKLLLTRKKGVVKILTRQINVVILIDETLSILSTTRPTMLTRQQRQHCYFNPGFLMHFDASVLVYWIKKGVKQYN